MSNLDKDVAMPVKRQEYYYEYAQHAWWTGYCPRCNRLIQYNFADNKCNRKQYCWRCGQLLDFTDV